MFSMYLKLSTDKIVFLPADLNTCIEVIGRAALHVLIYPEIGKYLHLFSMLC